MKLETALMLRYFRAVDRACRRNDGLSRDERARRMRQSRADGKAAECRQFYIVFVAEGTFCDFAKFWRLAFYGPTEFSASRWARCVV